jgi:hypothetical protein
MTKAQLANQLTEIKYGNWVLTGFKGDEKETKKSIFKICMGMTIKELNIALDNISIVS